MPVGYNELVNFRVLFFSITTSVPLLSHRSVIGFHSDCSVLLLVIRVGFQVHANLVPRTLTLPPSGRTLRTRLPRYQNGETGYNSHPFLADTSLARARRIAQNNSRYRRHCAHGHTAVLSFTRLTILLMFHYCYKV